MQNNILLEHHMFNDSSVEKLYKSILENPIKYFGEENGKITLLIVFVLCNRNALPIIWMIVVLLCGIFNMQTPFVIFESNPSVNILTFIKNDNAPLLYLFNIFIIIPNLIIQNVFKKK